jgi:hypothetical protein
LINYVWYGGYPHWQDETRPEYVLTMKDKIIKNPQGLFTDFIFDG